MPGSSSPARRSMPPGSPSPQSRPHRAAGRPSRPYPAAPADPRDSRSSPASAPLPPAAPAHARYKPSAPPRAESPCPQSPDPSFSSQWPEPAAVRSAPGTRAKSRSSASSVSWPYPCFRQKRGAARTQSYCTNHFAANHQSHIELSAGGGRLESAPFQNRIDNCRVLLDNQPVSAANDGNQPRLVRLGYNPSGCAAGRIAMRVGQHQPARSPGRPAAAHQQPTIPGMRVVDLANNLLGVRYRAASGAGEVIGICSSPWAAVWGD